MSKEVVKHETAVPDRAETFPNIYVDKNMIEELSQQVVASDEMLYSDEMLRGKMQEYKDFITRDDISPRSRQDAYRIVRHIGFELLYRGGYFDHAPDDLSDVMDILLGGENE